MSLPLAGRRLLVTRAAHQAGKLSDGLRAVGATVVEVPVLEIQPPASFDLLDAALRQIPSYDWLIFTSTNTVRAVLQRAAELQVEFAANRGKVAAVGQATAEALGRAGIDVRFVPDRYVAESLVEQFPEDCRGKRMLLARATLARDVIPEALRRAGAEVDVVDAYRNVLPAGASEQLKSVVSGVLDAATFTSSSTATHLAEAAEMAGIRFPLQGVKAVSIGPVTSATLRSLGWEPEIEASPHDVPGLIAATVRLLA